MSRLVAFGCSYTYGHGLSDCYNTKTNSAGLNPSKLGWVSIVGNNFNLETINRSCPGSSNKQIWNTIANTEFQSDDIVVVLWSLKERSCLISDKGEVTQLGMGSVWYHQKENKMWQVFSTCRDDYDFFFETAVYIELSNYYLQSRVSNVYNFTVMHELEEIDIDWMQTKFNDNAVELRNPVDLALDNSHPGLQANQLFAQKVKTHFRKDLKK